MIKRSSKYLPDHDPKVITLSVQNSIEEFIDSIG
jgi:hypothetical protein